MRRGKKLVAPADPIHLDYRLLIAQLEPTCTKVGFHHVYENFQLVNLVGQAINSAARKSNKNLYFHESASMEFSGYLNVVRKILEDLGYKRRN